MSSITQRRSSVALVVLIVLVLSIDTAHAVQRESPKPARLLTRAEVDAPPVARVSLVASRAVRAAPKATHRRPARPDARPIRRAQVTHQRRAPLIRPHRVVRVTSPTGWVALDEVISRIPSYRAGAAIWLVSNRYGHWGTADWYHATLYIAPTVPLSRLYDVAVHEWSHELSVLDYDGDVAAAVSAMNTVFGGSELVGAERAADCMARLQGASWTHYTSCASRAWRAAAARLVAGGRL